MRNSQAIAATRADYDGAGATTGTYEDYRDDKTWTTSAGFIPALTASELRLVNRMTADDQWFNTLDADGVTNFDYDYGRTLAN